MNQRFPNLGVIVEDGQVYIRDCSARVVASARWRGRMRNWPSRRVIVGWVLLLPAPSLRAVSSE